ncbi:MAG: helix-turn-helix transcriptional regulator [Pseudomonadota bacterium]
MGLPLDPQLSSVFRALADDTRLLILDELRKRNDQSLFEICSRMVSEHDITLSRQAFTRHLNALENAGLIATVWKGRTKVHSLTTDALGTLVAPWIRPFFNGDPP